MKLLIIESDLAFRRYLEAEARDEIIDLEVFKASSSAEAEEILILNPDIEIVFVDSRVPGTEKPEIRGHFRGKKKIIITSPNDNLLQHLKQDRECAVPLERVKQKLLEALHE
jgi:hypothetical protein